MSQVLTPEALAERCIILDEDRGFSVATITEPSLKEYISPVVGNRLLELAHHCSGRLILKHDLVREFSSAWINELLRLSTHCSGLGGMLISCGLRPENVQMLEATGLDKRLHVTDTERTARETFALRSHNEGTTVLGWLFGTPSRSSGRSRPAA